MHPKASLFLSVAAAIILGFVHTYALVAWFNWISMHTPVSHWLVDHGLRGGAFRGAVFAMDFATQVVLSVPAALVLVRLRPARLRVYLAAAVLPSFVLLNLQVLLDAPNLVVIATSWPAELLPLPLAAWLLRWRPATPARPAAA